MRRYILIDMRSGKTRAGRYEAKLSGADAKQRAERYGVMQRIAFGAGTHNQVMIENAVKRILEGAGASSVLQNYYIDFGKKIDKLKRIHSGRQAETEACIEKEKWVSRGLDGVVLEALLAAAGLRTCIVYVPCEYELDANTLALYHLNEGAGLAAADETGNFNATVTNAAIWTASAKCPAAAINCAGLYNLRQLTLLDACPANGTIEMWFRPNSTINSTLGTIVTLCQKYNSGGNNVQLYFQPGTGKLRFENAGGGVYKVLETTTSSWTGGVWYHVSATWGAEGMEWWVNGIRENNNAETLHMNDGTAYDFFAGCDVVGTTRFNGTIDELRVSDVQRNG